MRLKKGHADASLISDGHGMAWHGEHRLIGSGGRFTPEGTTMVMNGQMENETERTQKR